MGVRVYPNRFLPSDVVKMRLNQRRLVKTIGAIGGCFLILSGLFITFRYSNTGVHEKVGSETKCQTEGLRNSMTSVHISQALTTSTAPTTTTPISATAAVVPPTCLSNFGTVGIFLVYTNYAAYSHATNTLRCYAISRGYPLIIVHAFEDGPSQKECGHLRDVFFRKHCVASVYLFQFDWMMVSDADSAVVNSNHCIEEYLDAKADLIFMERFFSAELASGNYLVKNSQAGRHFLRSWAAMEAELPKPPIFVSSDNGFLHLHMIRVLFPENITLHEDCYSHLNESIWPNWEVGYGKFVGCTKRALINGQFSDKARAKVKILPRAQAWIRDTIVTGHNLWEGDFMGHGIKHAEPFNTSMLQRLSVFVNNTVPKECWNPAWQPVLVMGNLLDGKSLLSQLKHNADGYQRSKLNPVFGDPHFELCWPKCAPVVQNY